MSEPPPEPRLASRLLIRLVNALLLAYGLQAALVLGQPHPAPAALILALSAQLADQAVLPLLAVALLQLSSAVWPEDLPLQQRCHRQLEARLLTALLLLLLPLQLLLGGAELFRLDRAIRSDTEAVASRLRQVRSAILSADSRPALLLALERLQAPPLPPELQQRPLPQLKRSLLGTLAVAEQRSDSGSRPASEERARARGQLVQRLLQTSLLSLLYAFSLSPVLRLAGQRLGGRPRLGSGPLARHDHDYFQALSLEGGGDPAESPQPPARPDPDGQA